MGNFIKFTTSSGQIVNLNTDNVFEYLFVHASPNSTLTMYYEGTSISHTIEEVYARKMEKNLTKLLSVVDLSTISSQ